MQAVSAYGETFEICPRCGEMVTNDEIVPKDLRVPGACEDCRDEVQYTAEN